MLLFRDDGPEKRVASTGCHFFEHEEMWNVFPHEEMWNDSWKNRNYLLSAAICEATHQLARKRAFLVQYAQMEISSWADELHSSETVKGLKKHYFSSLLESVV